MAEEKEMEAVEAKPVFVRRNVTLGQREFETVRAFGRRHGLDFSSALRFVINEWARMKGMAPKGRGEGGVGS